jgi:hypothetical protein
MSSLVTISVGTAVLIKDLNQLRNEVAHSKFEPTQDAATSFAETCQRAAQRMSVEYGAWKEAQKQAKDWGNRVTVKK